MTFVFLLFLISDSSVRSKNIYLLCIFSISYPQKCSCFFFFTLFCTPFPAAVSLNVQQQLGLETRYKMGVDFILQGKQVKQKPTCTAVFVPSGSWGDQELSESQPGSSQHQFYCLCCWGCKGSSSPALLHLSVGLFSLTHRRHAGGSRAFFLLKTTAVYQKSRRKIQLEG